MKNRKTSIDCAFMQRDDVLRRAAMAQFKGGTALIYWLLLVFPISTWSQTFEISGKVIDIQGNAVEYAEVILLTTDSVGLQSQLCKEDGTFLIQNLYLPDYVVQIRTLGTIHFSQTIHINKNVDLGTITINPVINLQEVTIVATKKIIERKIDRLVFNVSNSLVAIGNDGLEVLRMTPSIRIIDDQISLVGRSSLKLMVNDKIIALSGNDLTNYLKNIKSEQIDKIEVIVNPPSKYDAEGDSGLINIILKNVPQNSFNGSLRGSLSQAGKSIGTTGLNLNYQKNTLSLSGNFSYTNGISEPAQKFDIYYPSQFWHEINLRKYHDNSFNSLITVDYKISPILKIGAYYNASIASPISNQNNNVFILNNKNDLDSLIKNTSRNEINRKTHDLTVYSEFILDSIGSKLNIDLNYLSYNSSNHNDFSGNTFDNNQNIVSNSFYHAINNGDLDINIYNVNIDYTLPVKWANFNLGTKLSFMKNKSSVDYYHMESNTPILDPSRTDKFNYYENIQAIYISGNKRINSKLQLQIGLRAEYLQSKGYSFTLDETNKDNNLKLFPTIYINYNVTDDHVLSFNYNKRINRPSYNLLNPFRFYSTSFNYSEGNPFLKPYYTDNINLSFIFQNYYTSIYFNRIRNKFDQITYVDHASTMQIVKPHNFYNVTGGGMYQEITFNIKNRWENSSDLSIYYNRVESMEPNVVPNNSSWTGSVSTNNTFIMDRNRRFRFFVNFLYQSPSLAGSYKLSDYYRLDCGFRANLFDDKLSLSISGSDILKTNKLTFTQHVNGIQQKSYDYRDIRRIHIALVYSFGKSFKLDKRKRINNDEIRRL